MTTQKRQFDYTNDVTNPRRFEFNDKVIPHQQQFDMSDKKIVNKRVLFGLMMDHNKQVSMNKQERLIKKYDKNNNTKL